MPSLRFADAPFETFSDLCRRVFFCMKRYGDKHGFHQYKKYEVFEGHWGGSQVLLTLCDLRVLSPEIVTRLQRILRKVPRWEIVVVISLPERDEHWPDMGMYIRGHEIIDRLRRQYFPPQFRDLKFEGAIPGGEDD